MPPILTFDDGRLSPSYGYLFDRRRLAPQETIVSIAWKIACMNALPGHIVARPFSQLQINPYRGIAATAVEVAVPVLARAFAIPRRALRNGVEPADGSRPMYSRLRFRTKCMKLGYHCVTHQRASATCCPCHRHALEEHCRGCGTSVQYRINVSLLNAPFRCAHCRRPYSGSGRSFAPRPPPADLRQAITRWRCKA